MNILFCGRNTLFLELDTEGSPLKTKWITLETLKEN